MTRSVRARNLALLAIVTGASMLVALRVGAAHGAISTALRDPASLDRAILEARGGRVILGALAGGALAAVGAAFQALLRNPLGDPYALGVSGGAALGASLVVVLGATGVLVPLGAFVGAVGATFAVLATARATRRLDAQGLLLAGLVFNAVANAALAFMRSVVSASKAQETLALLLGTVAEERAGTVAMVAALVGTGCLALWLLTKPMNLLSLGEESAASLGLDVRAAELLIFVAASVVVGGVVSVCGLIPFVGLLVPHYARALVGPDHRVLLPACFLGGATLLVLADAVTRAVFLWLGTEPPVGALTALVGGPFFFVLLRRMRESPG
ncbi:MAG: iron ABC transporter permease [Deltaproteobacteria bacterium]